MSNLSQISVIFLILLLIFPGYVLPDEVSGSEFLLEALPDTATELEKAIEPLPEDPWELYNRYYYDEACAAFDDAVQEDYHNLDLHVGRIWSYNEAERLYEATSSYAQKLTDDPDDYVAAFALGVCRYTNFKFGPAQDILEPLLDGHKEEPWLRYIHAVCVGRLRQDSNFDKLHLRAYKLLDELIADYPDFARAYVEKARYYGTSRNIYYRIVRSIFPGPFANHEREKGISILEEGLKNCGPDQGLIREMFDYFYYRRWFNPAFIIEKVDEFGEPVETMIPVRESLAHALNNIGHRAEAAREWYRMMRIAPNYANIYSSLGDLYINDHRYDEALLIYRKGLKVQHQLQSRSSIKVSIGQAYYKAGRYEEAGQYLKELLESQDSSIRMHAQNLLSVIRNAGPDSVRRVVDGVPYVRQVGLYCGPATLSMNLGFWGIARDQHTIAAKIFNGVQGTAPELMTHYALKQGLAVKNFQLDRDNLRACIDAGFPILWLKFMKGGGGHYFVISGYDDISGRIILHNPWHPFEIVQDYNYIHDEMPVLPDLRQAFLLYPPEREADVAALGLETPWWSRAFISAWSTVTGANLYSGLIRGILINLLLSAVLFGIIKFTLRFYTYDLTPVPAIKSWGTALGSIFILNLMAWLFPNRLWISLLLSIYLVWFVLILSFFILGAMLFVRKEFISWRTYRFVLLGLVFLGFLKGWYWTSGIPLSVSLILCLLLILYLIKPMRANWLGDMNRNRRNYEAALHYYYKAGTGAVPAGRDLHCLIKEVEVDIFLRDFEAAAAGLKLLDESPEPPGKWAAVIHLLRAELELWRENSTECKAALDKAESLKKIRRLGAYYLAVAAAYEARWGDKNKAAGYIEESNKRLGDKPGLTRDDFAELRTFGRNRRREFALFNLWTAKKLGTVPGLSGMDAVRSSRLTTEEYIKRELNRE